MDARELKRKINYTGQERALRTLAVKEKLLKPEEAAVMIDLEIYEKILEHYEVVFSSGETIGLVRKSDMPTYIDIVKEINR